MLLLTTTLLAATIPPPPQESALLSAVPDDAFALVRVLDASAFRARAEQNDWVNVYGSDDGEQALQTAEQEFEATTGADFDGLFQVAQALHGETLLFVTAHTAGFVTEPPADRADLSTALSGWLDEGHRTLEVSGVEIRLGPWPDRPEQADEGVPQYLAFLDHPQALGLYGGESEEAILATLTNSLEGLLTGTRRAPVVEGFLGAGGGTTDGIEAFVDFTPFIAQAEEDLRRAVEGFLPDPTGLLGLEAGTWLFLTADLEPGTHVELEATLRIPEDSLAARLADSFEPLDRTLPADLPRGTWLVYALNWNLPRFYTTAREGFEQVDENGLAMVDGGLAAAQLATGVDPIQDVLRQLSGLFALYHVLESDADTPVDGEDGFGLLLGLVDGHEFMDAFEALLGVGGIGIQPIELEGAETYLASDEELVSSDQAVFGDIDGGLSILPHRMLFSISRETLVRGLQALGRVDGSGLAWGSALQAAFDENPGCFAFTSLDLRHVRTLALMMDGESAPEENDPFQSRLIFAAKRTAQGFEARLYTR